MIIRYVLFHIVLHFKHFQSTIQRKWVIDDASLDQFFAENYQFIFCTKK